MDPPEEKHQSPKSTPTPSSPSFSPTQLYSLGDAGSPEHMTVFYPTSLKPSDYCFVRRSGGGGVFTFAKVVSIENGQDGIPNVELQVDDEGATKTIPVDQCRRYVRILIANKSAPSTVTRDYLSKHQMPYQPTRSGTASCGFNGTTTTRRPPQPRRSSSERLHASFQSGLSNNAPPANQQSIPQQRRGGLQRRASVAGGSFTSSGIATDGNNKPSRRASMRRSSSFKGGNLHASFQSGLNRGSSGTAQASHQNTQQKQQQSSMPSPRSSARMPAMRRGSSFSLRSSICTQMPSLPFEENDLLLDDDEFELSSVEAESESSNSDSSSDGNKEDTSHVLPLPDTNANKNEDLPTVHEMKKPRRSITSDATDPISSDEGGTTPPPVFTSRTNAGEDQKRNSRRNSMMGSMTDSMRRVSLPGFDDIEFNEESLRLALGTIAK